jgi:cell division protein FtsB
MKNLRFSWKYALAIILVAFMGYMVMGFNNRMANLRRLQAQYEQAQKRLEGVMAENAALQTQIAIATTDATVIQWAYSQGHLIQPGDVPVVPLAPGGSTPTPVPTPTAPQLPVENWQIWMLLFVDKIKP